MTRIDKVMSVLLRYIVPEDTEELKSVIMAEWCPKEPYVTCSGCKNDPNKRIRCWKGEEE